MASFVRGQPIATREPFVTVDAGLEPGLHRFQLEVVTDDRRVSEPATVVVQVTERRIVRPLDPLDPREPDDPFRPLEPLRPDDPLRRDPVPPDGE